MTGKPHHRPEFRNAVTYMVAITYTVEGGARQGTADRRASKIAERLANNVARASGVVDVSATVDRSYGGEVVCPEPVRFAAANSGQGTWGAPRKLDRYLDPEHERAREAQEAEDAAHRERQHADRSRRLTVGCRNAYRVGSCSEPTECLCVYCAPGEHADALRLVGPGRPTRFVSCRCICGEPQALPGQRCLLHRDVQLVALEGDPNALRAIVNQQQEPRP